MVHSHTLLGGSQLHPIGWFIATSHWMDSQPHPIGWVHSHLSGFATVSDTMIYMGVQTSLLHVDLGDHTPKSGITMSSGGSMFSL